MYRMATVSENLQDIQTLQTNTNSHETSDDDPPESKRKKLEDETKSSSQIVQPAKIQHISDDEESDDGAFCTVVSLLTSSYLNFVDSINIIIENIMLLLLSYHLIFSALSHGQTQGSIESHH